MFLLDDYLQVLKNCKTEYECVDYIKNMALQKGYKENGKEKGFICNRDKSCLLYDIKDCDLSKGLNIIVSHIDSPRLDLKPNPLYEEGHLGLLKTHYYGGIKTYQWTTIPLEIHGIVYDSNGKKIDIYPLFEDTSFCISDILPHFAKDQNNLTMDKGVSAEQLNVVVGSLKLRESEKTKVIDLLLSKGIKYDTDFVCGDICFIPKLEASYIGFDKAIIGGYGQDDRVSMYCSLMAQLDKKEADKGTITIFADKEEIGSEGVTSLQSNWWINALKNILGKDADIDNILSKSTCLCADVKGAFDPNYPEVFDKNNCAYINEGVCIVKNTANTAKSGGSECSVQTLSRIVNHLYTKRINYQLMEVAKLGKGQSSTLSKYIARQNIEVLDVGVPLLNMHSPYELVGCNDIKDLYKMFIDFFEEY